MTDRSDRIKRRRGNNETDPTAMADTTPNDELRELIDKWRNGTLPREGTFNQAADQLEELIDDE